MAVEFSSSVLRVASHDGSGHIDANHNNVSQAYAVSVQDSESDDSNEKKRKYKRKKRNTGFSFWLVVWRWKIEILALVLMAAIVVSEVRRLSYDRSSYTRIDVEEPKTQETTVKENRTGSIDEKPDDEKPFSLDNMDMPLHRGTPCLELLPSEKLEQFQLPYLRSSSQVKRLQYVEHISSVKNWLEERPMDTAFVGGQTMEERAKSFEVQATMKVHCGFCDEGNEFYINAKDKSFMAECKIVVLTCTFGGGDDLYQPIGMTDASLSKVCYVAFWDEVTLNLQAVKGQAPDLENHKVGLWRVVLVQNLPFSDQRRNGKIPKLLNHRLFPQARYSIWVDSKSQFRRDPIGVIEALLMRPKSVFAISEHGGRSCVYKEGEAIVQKHKAPPEEVARQLQQYHTENFPERALFDGHKALAEASVIVREHTPLTNLFMCNWFNEVMRFTARDQLSFPYVLLNLEVMHPNMFPICTRRALVNSIGHAGKKPKPLNTRWT